MVLTSNEPDICYDKTNWLTYAFFMMMSKIHNGAPKTKKIIFPFFLQIWRPIYVTSQILLWKQKKQKRMLC